MQSIYGLLGQICSHYSWTLDYALWGADWRIIQRMLIDAPSFDYDKESDNTNDNSNKKVIKLTEQNADDVMAMLKELQ